MTSGDCVSRGLSVWTAHCKCGRCQRQRRHIYKLRDQGRYVRVPATEALAAIDWMMSLGYNGPAVGSACGIKPSTATGWLVRRRRGEDIKFGPAAAYKIVNAGQPTIGRAAAEIPRRKLQALACLGWGVKELNRIMLGNGILPEGDSRVTMYRVRSHDITALRVPLLTAINEIYLRLNMHQAPSDRHHNGTRNAALRRGWVPPAAWDDIDDPECRPDTRGTASRHRTDVDEIAIERACAGDLPAGFKLTTAERRIIVSELRHRGIPDQEITRRTKIAQLDRYPRELPQATESQAS